MTSTAVTVVQEIDAHIRKCGGGYSTWYVGIASDARDRLFNDHGVHEKGDAWIIRDAGSESEARRIEKYFLDRGCKGGGGGGDHTTHFVYAYKINSHTRE